MKLPRQKCCVQGQDVSLSARFLASSNIDALTFEDVYSQVLNEGKMVLYGYMQVRPRSESECRERLAKEAFLLTEIDTIVEALKNDKLIDDKRFASFMVEGYQVSRPLGEFLLKQKMMDKGIDAVIIEEALQDYAPSDDVWILDAMKILNYKKHLFVSQDGSLNKHKMVDYLYRRGFSSTIGHNAVKDFLENSR